MTTWERVEPDRLAALLDGARAAVWRWECRGDYSVVDADLLRRWRAGLGRDPDEDRPWVEYVRGLRRRGVRFERARRLTEPLTEYLRMQLELSHMNVEAGADVRWVASADAAETACRPTTTTSWTTTCSPSSTSTPPAGSPVHAPAPPGRWSRATSRGVI